MGLPASGKSTLAASFVERGYTRLNRDETGGSLAALVPRVAGLVASGATRFVADNTCVTRQSRAALLDAAARLGLRVRGLWLTTSIEDAQSNAVWRMVSRYGRLLAPEEIRETSKRDPGVFAPGVLFRYQREIEPPEASEGFGEVEHVPFARHIDPAWSNRAVIVWADGVLRCSRAGHRTPCRLTISTSGSRQARCCAVTQTTAMRSSRSAGDRRLPKRNDGRHGCGDRRAHGRAARRAGRDHDCPHPAGPPVCWCRKPLPGLGVLCVHRHRLDPARSVYVGASPQDPGFARRCGFRYVDAQNFLAN